MGRAGKGVAFKRCHSAWAALQRVIRCRGHLALAAVCLAMAAGCAEPPPPPAELVAEAESRVDQGRRSEAIVLLLRALRQNPEDPGVRWRLGELYLQAGATDFALSHLQAALDAGMSASVVLPLVAKAHLFAGDIDALFELELPVGLSPEAKAEVVSLRAQARAVEQRFDAAERLLRKAAALDADGEAVQFARARFFVEQGHRSRAEDELRALLEAYPESSESLGMLADLLRDAGELQDAERLYSRALEQAVARVHLHFLRAEVRLDLGDAAGAEADAAAIEALAPGSFAARYPRARLLLLDGQIEAALAGFEAANKSRPSHPATLLYGGLAAYAAGRINLAEDWLLRALKEAPRNTQAHLVLGAIRFSQRRYAEAEDYLRPVPAAMPDNPVPRRLLAAALVAQNKAAEAVSLLSELVIARPDDPRSQLDLSVALVLSGAKQRGVSILDGLVARHPDYRPAYEYLIAFYVRERQWHAAEQWAERFVRQYPDAPRARFFQGEVLREAGRAADARAAYRRALELDPANPDANMRLGELALADADPERASGHFARILTAHPGNLDALMGQGRVAAVGGRFEDAEGHLDAAIAAHPDALAPRMMLARQLYARGEFQRAASVLQSDAAPSFRRDAQYLQLLAESLLAAETPQQAADIARELVARLPDSLEAYGLYARILTVLDDKIALEETLKQMLTIDPAHVPTRLQLVRLHIATGRFEVAERLLNPLLTGLERPPLADLLYGLILTATERPVQAVAPLKHAFGVAPSERTLLALANAEAQSGRLDDAIERQAEWLEAHPSDVEVRVNLAGHLVEAERMSDALAEYDRALSVNPDHIVALNNLAWYSVEQDPARSVELAERALSAHPASLEAAHTLVTAQVEAGEWRNAALTLDRAMARHPTDPGLLWLSARVLHQKGQSEYALRRLERLLEAELPAQERERARVLLAQIEDEIRAEQAKVPW